MNIFSLEKVTVVTFLRSGLNGYLNGMNFVAFIKDDCDACDERGNFEGCRYACFLSVADVGTILPVVMKPRKPR